MCIGAKYPAEFLTREEVLRLLASWEGDSPKSLRYRALVAVLYRGGLRISEALSLRMTDLFPVQGVVRIRHGKGDKARTVAIDSAAWCILKTYIDRRAAIGLPAEVELAGPVFCRGTGRPIGHSAVLKELRQRAAKAGIGKRVHPHIFRHTHAVELREEGVDIAVISKQLGHTAISTTARYLDHLYPGAVAEAISKRKWEV